MKDNLSQRLHDHFQPGSMKPALRHFKHIKRYWDQSNKSFVAKILPGEYYVTTNDELIVTTLGSCISTCIRDAKNGVGGMNHFMLPMKMENDGIIDHPRVSVANRYGNHAMENLVTEILKNGGNRDNLEVKIFGGGKILASMTDIGKRNVDFIEEYIRTEGFRLIASDVGDTYPRKVIYDPMSGKARVKKLKSINNDTIYRRETEYMETVDNQPVDGEIELFK